MLIIDKIANSRLLALERYTNRSCPIAESTQSRPWVRHHNPSYWIGVFILLCVYTYMRICVYAYMRIYAIDYILFTAKYCLKGITYHKC